MSRPVKRLKKVAQRDIYVAGYDKGFKAGQKQSEDAFKEMIESCDEEPCCHGIQKNELLSKIGDNSDNSQTELLQRKFVVQIRKWLNLIQSLTRPPKR